MYVLQPVCTYACVLRREHLVGLLCDADEGGPPAQLLELGGAHVCAGGAEASQHLADGVLHISSVRNLHGLSLRRPESGAEKVGTQADTNSNHFVESYFTEGICEKLYSGGGILAYCSL